VSHGLFRMRAVVDANGTRRSGVTYCPRRVLGTLQQWRMPHFFATGNAIRGSNACVCFDVPIYMDRHHLPEDAHHQLSGTILDVDPTVPLNTLLGERSVYPAGTPYEAPVMRAIVFTDLCGSVEHTFRLGDYEHLELVRVHDKVVRELLGLHNGREVKHTGDGIMASFTSVASAVTFAITAQRAFRDHNDGNPVPLDVKIGISAGEPITDHNDDLFGASVQLAARLCDSAPAGEIGVSLAVRELCIGKRFHFRDCGPVQLKGLSEPTSLYCVSWRDG
jgi:class 3 adenylate cyclase